MKPSIDTTETFRPELMGLNPDTMTSQEIAQRVFAGRMKTGGAATDLIVGKDGEVTYARDSE